MGCLGDQEGARQLSQGRFPTKYLGLAIKAGLALFAPAVPLLDHFDTSALFYSPG